MYTYSGGCSPAALLHSAEFKMLLYHLVSQDFFHVSSELTMIMFVDTNKCHLSPDSFSKFDTSALLPSPSFSGNG